MVDAVDGAVEGGRSLVVRVFPGVLEVGQDVRDGRDVGRVIDKDDDGLSRVDEGAEGGPGVLGEGGGARCVDLGGETSGLEGGGKRGCGLVVGVDNEDGDDVVRVRVDPRLDLGEVALEGSAILKLAAVQSCKVG